MSHVLFIIKFTILPSSIINTKRTCLPLQLSASKKPFTLQCYLGVARWRKTSWFFQRRSLTPWWAAEWSGGIIPCIIQQCKLTLSGDTPSIKSDGGGAAIKVCWLGEREECEWRVECRWWLSVCIWESVRWNVMERESEVRTRISHPLFQQVALTVTGGMWTGSGRNCLTQCGTKTPSGPESEALKLLEGIV